MFVTIKNNAKRTLLINTDMIHEIQMPAIVRDYTLRIGNQEHLINEENYQKIIAVLRREGKIVE